MHRPVLIAAILTVMLPIAPSLAVTAKAKMATCKFGADDQKLPGKQRAAFIKKCMAKKNDPRGTPMALPPATTQPR
jgi:hypothetical protein